MFNAEFFPTPRGIARRMLSKVRNKNAKYFLEPSAGKGDLAEVLRAPMSYEELLADIGGELSADERADKAYRSYKNVQHNCERLQIDVIEREPSLAAVLTAKEFTVVGYDWLTYDGTSYYDAIIMNPPFSEGAAHLMKAWEFLHSGEIVCLLNEQTLLNPHTEDRRRLMAIVEQNGHVEYLGECFRSAERQTDVRIAMVYLCKKSNDDAFDLWGKSAGGEKAVSEDFDFDNNMLAIQDSLGNREHWYNMANKHFVEALRHARIAASYLGQNKVADYDQRLKFPEILAMGMKDARGARTEFLRQHRKQAWTAVFHDMEFNKWLDSKQQESLLRDVQKDSAVPFTAANIHSTLENVVAMRGKLFDQSVANVFDALTSHHAGNTNVQSEGWKTNDGYKVNERMVFPYGVSFDNKFTKHFETWRCHGQHAQATQDLDRILCVLEAKPYESCYTVNQGLKHSMDAFNNGHDTSKCGESKYFEFRFFQKGTLHLKWKRLDLLEQFNRRAAAGKMWIGENTRAQRQTKKQREEEQSRDVHWECRSGHEFVAGVCSKCHVEQGVDTYALIECELCRAVCEETGLDPHCPLHPIPEHALPVAAAQLLIEGNQ